MIISLIWLCLWFLLATRGKGYQGDIAIDDLSIAVKPGCQLYSGSLPSPGSTVAPFTTAAPNNCLPSQFACVSDGKCITLGQVCDFNLDCADGSDERTCCKYDLMITVSSLSSNTQVQWSMTEGVRKTKEVWKGLN